MKFDFLNNLGFKIFRMKNTNEEVNGVFYIRSLGKNLQKLNLVSNLRCVYIEIDESNNDFFAFSESQIKAN